MENYSLLESQIFIPKYLTPESADNLKKELEEQFPYSSNDKMYIFKKADNIFYQGDCLIDIPYYNFEKQQILYFDAMIISNTCSIDLRNKRFEHVDINLAMIYPLDAYIKQLEGKNIEEERIKGVITDIKKNNINHILYLPEVQNGDFTFPESIVRLDRITTLDAQSMQKYDPNFAYHDDNGDVLVTLQNYGFYLLLFKLSVSFSRFQEGIDRNTIP